MPLQRYPFDLAERPAEMGIGIVPDNRIAAQDGIGIAAPAAPMALQAPEMPQQPLQMARPQRQPMGDGDRMAYALEAFGAGMRGQPSLAERERGEQRKEKLLQTQELKAHIDALESGAKIAKTMQGSAKTNFTKDYAAQLEQMRPGLGSTFSNIAEDPGLLDNIQNLTPFLPPMMRMLAKTNPDGFLKIIGSVDGWKIMKDAETSFYTDLAQKKGAMTIGRVQQFGLPAELAQEAMGSPNAATFKKVQAALPDGHPAKLTDAEWKAIDSTPTTQKMFYNGLNMPSPEEMATTRTAAENKKNTIIKVETGGSTRLIREGDVPAEGMVIPKEISPAQEESNRLREESNRIHATLAGVSLDLRRQGLVQQAERIDQQRNQFNDTRAEKLANELQQNKIPGLQSSIRTANEMLQKYADKDIPGFGLVEGSAKIPNAIRPAEATNVRSAVQAVTNDLLNLYSGLAVTLPEADRRELEQMNRGDFTNKDFKNAWPRIVGRFNSVLGNMRASASTEVVERYASRPGAMSLDPIQPAFAKPEKNAPGASVETSVPLPKTRAQLETGKFYQTARGVAKWNGDTFDPPVK